MLVYIASVLSGIGFLLRRSGWKWAVETKRENDFSWPSVIGIILLGDYRRHVHLNRYDGY